MKPDHSPPLASLLAKLVDRGLNDAEKSKLQEILRKNPAARQYYRLYLSAHLELAEEAPRMSFPPATPARTSRRFRVPLAIAALIPILLALALWAPWRDASPGPDGNALATITASEGARWSFPETPKPGLGIPAGRIGLTAGSLALEFGENQIVTLAAPTDFEIISRSEIFIHQGKASLRVVGDASPYVMRVPRGTVVDLGTEFAVTVAADGIADVWVFEGKALVSLTAGSAARQQQALTSGQSLRIGQTLVPSPLKASEFIRPLHSAAGAPVSSSNVIADFSADFPRSTLGPGQPFGGTETPATGWKYLWNPSGTLGDPSSYQSLVPNTVNTFPAANGGGIAPMFTHLGDVAFNSMRQGAFHYGRIATTSIHPGRFVPGKDYRAIIAYTIQPGEAGRIAIANSSLAKYRIDGSPANGVDLDILVNDRPVSALGKDGFQSLTTSNFNGSLGSLSVGDTVYVALGNNGADGAGGNDIYDAYDACVIDFQLVRVP
jgi:hypothetical protein